MIHGMAAGTVGGAIMSTTIYRRVLVLASLIALAWTAPTRADPSSFR